MNPRRILFVTRLVEGGLSVVVENLARGINSEKYESIVLTKNCGESDFKENLVKSGIDIIEFGKVGGRSVCKHQTKNKNIGAKMERFFGAKGRSLYFSLKSFRDFVIRDIPLIRLFVKILKEYEIDLVHTHHNLTICKPEIIAAWLVGVPCISHLHSYKKLTGFDFLFRKFVDVNVCISRSVFDDYINQGLQKGKGQIIHNGVNMNKFSQAHPRDEVRREFCCKPDELLIGSIGRIDWWKGHEYFIEAISIVIEKFPQVKGLIVGSLTYPTKENLKYQKFLHSLVCSKGLSEKIIFTGHRKDIPEIMASLDVVVHASSEPEPFGLVIIEGMAAAKPVVATAAGGVLDIIEDEVNGFLVPCSDSNEMAIVILRILSDYENAKQVGINARKSVGTKFTLQQQVNNIEELYNSLLGL